MSIEERIKKEKEELKNKIFHATWEILIKDGYDKFSVRKLAKKIDYSATTIYLYYKNKEELIQAVNQKGFETFIEEMSEYMKKAKKGPLEQLKASLRFYIYFWIRNPQIYKMLFLNVKGYTFPNLLPDKDNDIVKANGFAILAGFLSECIKKKIIRNIELKQLTLSVWSSLHGMTLFLIENKNFDARQKDKYIEIIIDIILNGLLK